MLFASPAVRGPAPGSRSSSTARCSSARAASGLWGAGSVRPQVRPSPRQQPTIEPSTGDQKMNPKTASSIGLAALTGALGMSMTAPRKPRPAHSTLSHTRSRSSSVVRTSPSSGRATPSCRGSALWWRNCLHDRHGAGGAERTTSCISLQGGPFEPGATKPIDFVVDLGSQTSVELTGIIGGAAADTLTCRRRRPRQRLRRRRGVLRRRPGSPPGSRR